MNSIRRDASITNLDPPKRVSEIPLQNSGSLVNNFHYFVTCFTHSHDPEWIKIHPIKPVLYTKNFPTWLPYGVMGLHKDKLNIEAYFSLLYRLT